MTLYLAGIFTPFVLIGLWLLVGELLRRNLALECGDCGKRIGILPSEAEVRGIKPSFTYVTRIKMKLHHIKCK